MRAQAKKGESDELQQNDQKEMKIRLPTGHKLIVKVVESYDDIWIFTVVEVIEVVALPRIKNSLDKQSRIKVISDHCLNRRYGKRGKTDDDGFWYVQTLLKDNI